MKDYKIETLIPHHIQMFKYTTKVRNRIFWAIRRTFAAGVCSNCGGNRRDVESRREEFLKAAVDPTGDGPKYDERHKEGIMYAFYKCHLCNLDDNDVYEWKQPYAWEIVFDFWYNRDANKLDEIFKDWKLNEIM